MYNKVKLFVVSLKYFMSPSGSKQERGSERGYLNKLNDSSKKKIITKTIPKMSYIFPIFT